MFLFPQWRYFTFYSIVNVPRTFPSFLLTPTETGFEIHRGVKLHIQWKTDGWGFRFCVYTLQMRFKMFSTENLSLKSAPRKGYSFSIDASIKTDDWAIRLHLHFIGQRYCLGKWAPCELNEENKQEKKHNMHWYQLGTGRYFYWVVQTHFYIAS